MQAQGAQAMVGRLAKASRRARVIGRGAFLQGDLLRVASWVKPGKRTGSHIVVKYEEPTLWVSMVRFSMEARDAQSKQHMDTGLSVRLGESYTLASLSGSAAWRAGQGQWSLGALGHGCGYPIE